MSTLTRRFMNLSFSISDLGVARAIDRWHARRLDAHNLARLSSRDLRDMGMTAETFAFRTNHALAGHEPTPHGQQNHAPRYHAATETQS